MVEASCYEAFGLNTSNDRRVLDGGETGTFRLLEIVRFESALSLHCYRASYACRNGCESDQPSQSDRQIERR